MTAIAVGIFEIIHKKYFLLGGYYVDRREIRRLANARIDRLLDTDAKVIENTDRNPRL